VLLGCGVLVQFHLWIIMLYYVCYLIVNAGVTLGTNLPIYSVLDYINGATGIWIAVAFVLGPLFFFEYTSWDMNTPHMGHTHTHNTHNTHTTHTTHTTHNTCNTITHKCAQQNISNTFPLFSSFRVGDQLPVYSATKQVLHSPSQ